MSRRSKNWNEALSKEIKNIDFAREFIMASLEEGLALQEVLSKVIRAYGIKEFAKVSEIAEPNIIRAIDSKHNPTQKTLIALLKPFGLKLSVAVCDVA